MTTATTATVPESVEVLHHKLRSGTPEERADAAHKLAEIKSHEQTDIVVSVYDKL